MSSAAGPLGCWPFHCGVGLKSQHVPNILAEWPKLGFFEVHAENYMGEGGAPHRHLTAIRELYPLSVHGVGLSLGGAADLDEQHLGRLCKLVRRYEPVLVSEHLAWSSHVRGFLNDLLPVPYTPAALRRVVSHVDRVQMALGRQILLENPSTYLSFAESEIEETAFIAEIARRTGCGLLLDVNNVYVSCANQGCDPDTYLERFPMQHVREIHLAGHATRCDSNGIPLLVDSHDRTVSEPVWALYRSVMQRLGPRPTLIERDADIPSWRELYREAWRAETEMTGCGQEDIHALAC